MEITKEQIQRANTTVNMFVEEYEEILENMKKNGATKQNARRMLIMVQGLMFAFVVDKIADVVKNAPYPDNEVLKSKFELLLKLVEKQKNMGI